MEAIETRTVEHGGYQYRIRVYADEDAPNPLDDWPDMGTILSLNRRHRNYDPDGIEAALAGNADAVPLGYFEHGRCLWCVAGELPAGASCPWDSVTFAGVWLPDAGILAEAMNYGGWTRRQFMRRRAREACDAYTLWCNGDVYGYRIDRLAECRHCCREAAEPVESGWGYFGLDQCLSAAMEAIP